MIRKIFQIALASTLLFSCKTDHSKDGVATKNTDNTDDSALNESFNGYKERFIENLWQVFPAWATSQGYHTYDSVLVIPNADRRAFENGFAAAHLDSLKKFDIAQLNANNKTDWYMMENQLKSFVWSNNEMKSYEWDPSQYNVSSTCFDILNNKKETLNNKVTAVLKRLQNVDQYYAAARLNIKNPTNEHVSLAISQLEGGLDLIKSIGDSLQKSTLPVKDTTNIHKAICEVKDFVATLKSIQEQLKKNPKQARDFRLGKTLYDAKFEFDIQSGLTAEQVYNKALNRKSELLGKMFDLATKLWPKYMKNKVAPKDTTSLVKQVIDEIAKKHVKREEFQSEIERQIPVLTQFVKEKNLVYMDPKKPLTVRKEPEWMGGVAGASITAPGPYDKDGETFYNVGSIANYSPEEAESYLREYNYYILQILNIHEAIPGHYVQLIYSNQSPSLIKSLFGNGAMVEGWAVYTERMMLEEGWGNNEDEMWLMYYKWNMRVTCNTILDYSTHVLGWTKEQALNLLQKQAFQEKAEAEGKWRRCTLTQVQLCSYFTGFSEIYDLRNELKTKQGKDFNLKAFHEKFLSYGSAPVKFIRELMLSEIK